MAISQRLQTVNQSICTISASCYTVLISIHWYFAELVFYFPCKPPTKVYFCYIPAALPGSWLFPLLVGSSLSQFSLLIIREEFAAQTLKPAWKEALTRDGPLFFGDRTSWHHGCGGLYEVHKIYVIFL